MAKIDQSTRRGRLTVVFIGGIILFGGLTLFGFYLSQQRQHQLEAGQDEPTQVATLEDMEGANEEVAENSQGEAPKEESTEAPQVSNEEDEDPEQQVATTGPSASQPNDETNSETSQLPSTGPSQAGAAPAELPATGPETFWIVAIVGVLIAGYLGFEYRRSRLAFERAALRK